jgi:hypothetical protein
MRCKLDAEKQIAGLAPGSRLPLTGETNLLTLLNACRNLDLQRARTPAHTVAPQAQGAFTATEGFF